MSVERNVNAHCVTQLVQSFFKCDLNRKRIQRATQFDYPNTGAHFFSITLVRLPADSTVNWLRPLTTAQGCDSDPVLGFGRPLLRQTVINQLELVSIGTALSDWLDSTCVALAKGIVVDLCRDSDPVDQLGRPTQRHEAACRFVLAPSVQKLINN